MVSGVNTGRVERVCIGQHHKPRAVVLLAPHPSAPSASCSIGHLRTAQALRGRGSRPLGLHGGHGPPGGSRPSDDCRCRAGEATNDPIQGQGSSRQPGMLIQVVGLLLLKRNAGMTSEPQLRSADSTIRFAMSQLRCERTLSSNALGALNPLPDHIGLIEAPGHDLRAVVVPGHQLAHRRQSTSPSENLKQQKFLAWAACKGIPAECPGEHTVRCCRGCGAICGIGGRAEAHQGPSRMMSVFCEESLSCSSAGSATGRSLSGQGGSARLVTHPAQYIYIVTAAAALQQDAAPAGPGAFGREVN